MKILLLNPPNCGRSIPEERYGITAIKQIFRGEPLALEILAGNLRDHQLRIVDLKAAPDELPTALAEFRPDLVALTGVTCEANTVLSLAREIKQSCGALTVVGGIHASNDPELFNREEIDYIVAGLGKASLRELVDTIEQDRPLDTPGVCATAPGQALQLRPRPYSKMDLLEELPPRYDLVSQYREEYRLASLGFPLGLVASAFGCPFDCSFCCIAGQAGGRYLTQSIASVVRDIQLLEEIPVIRLVDANTFGNPAHARQLCEAIQQAGIKKNFLADVRADTVVNHPELLAQWREAGLKSVVIGFEEITDSSLARLNKASRADDNLRAIQILHDLGITIVGDFILSPEYDEKDFERLGSYIEQNRIDLPLMTVLTPLPGTALHRAMSDRISETDLDYYTLTNAVTPTRLPEETFYRLYADLLSSALHKAKL